MKKAERKNSLNSENRQNTFRLAKNAEAINDYDNAKKLYESLGIENIKLFEAWGGYTFGAWQGVFIGMLGGALFGLIHAIATVSFQVDHIVSGVAINILAAGVARINLVIL